VNYFPKVINIFADMLKSAAKVNARIGKVSRGWGVTTRAIRPAALAKNTVARARISSFFMVYKLIG
jgi:hypothetical protein